MGLRTLSDRSCAGRDAPLIRAYSAEMAELTAHPNLFGGDEKTLEVCGRWDRFCTDLFHSYQDLALVEVEGGAR